MAAAIVDPDPRVGNELEDIRNENNVENRKNAEDYKNPKHVILCNSFFQNVIFFSIGDIESHDFKMEKIINFIMANPSRDFVFLGDIFNNLSFNCDLRPNGLNCLKLLDNSGLLNNNELNALTDFKELQFGVKQYQDISSRVKFIVGNAECDLLFDIISDLDNKSEDESGFFSFGDPEGKWFKKFTWTELSLLYKYLSSCHGAISYPLNNETTIWIRHSFGTFRSVNNVVVNQMPDIKPSPSTPVVCGHNKQFGLLDENIFMNDTSLDTEDIRICALGLDGGRLHAESLSLDFTFPVLEGHIYKPKGNKKNHI